MKKKIVYAGVLFLLIAIVMIFASGGLVKNSLSGLASFNNITIGSSGFYFSTLNVTNVTRFFMVMKSNSSLNVYLFNTAAFTSWYGHMRNSTNTGLNGLAEAKALEGSGAVDIFNNTDYVSFLQTSNSTTPLYAANTAMAPGAYTVVLDNSNGSVSYLHKVYVELLLPSDAFFSAKSLSSFNGSFVDVELVGLVIIILFILALLFIVYGLISKHKQQPQDGGTQRGDVSKDEVDELYSNVGKGKK